MFNNEFYQAIHKSDDTSNIKTIAMLRYYIDIYGYNKKILQMFNGKSKDEIDYAVHNCFGRIDISNLVNNFDETIYKCEEEVRVRNEYREKYYTLIDEYEGKKESFCKVSIKSIKHMLSLLLKKDDNIASILRLMFDAYIGELEAKNDIFYFESYSNKEINAIKELIGIYSNNNFNVWKTNSRDILKIPIIIFELPNNEKIIFKNELIDLTEEEFKNLKEYEEDDIFEESSSNLIKMENFISKHYKKEINEKLDKAKPKRKLKKK